MLPAMLMAKAIQLCAAGAGSAVPVNTAQPEFAVHVHAGATMMREPTRDIDAVATVRDLLVLGADFDAGPLAISGRDFATYGVTPETVFDACALAHIDPETPSSPGAISPTVSGLSALVRRAFDARITDSIRPITATYGAVHSWHKVGQAIDFVPAGGVTSITREQIRSVMAANGIRLLELLGPGDPGHSNHWHIAFARPGQIIDHIHPVEGDEDWLVNVNVAAGQAPSPTDGADRQAATAIAPPPAWDVFAAADWRATHGGGS